MYYYYYYNYDDDDDNNNNSYYNYYNSCILGGTQRLGRSTGVRSTAVRSAVLSKTSHTGHALNTLSTNRKLCLGPG